MASVSFSIEAIDKTRAVFASLNQGLKSLTGGSKGANDSLASMGLKLAGVGTVAALSARSIRNVWENMDQIKGIPPSTIQSWYALRGAADSVSSLGTKLSASLVGAAGHMWELTKFATSGEIAFLGYEGAMQRYKQRLDESAEAGKEATGYYDRLRTSVINLGQAQIDLANINETQGQNIVRRREDAAAMESVAALQKDEIKRIEQLTVATRMRSGAEGDLWRMRKEMVELEQKAGLGQARLMRSTMDEKSRIRDLQSALQQTNIELAQFNDLQNPVTVEKRIAVLNRQVTITEQLAKAQERSRKTAQEFGDTIAGSFEDAVFAGKSVREMINGIGNDLARLLFRKLITEQIAGGIASVITGLPIFGGARASGGPVGGGSSYLVGEKGPEIFTPSSAGRIIPNHEVGGSGGGGGTVFNIDARGATHDAIQEMKQMVYALAGPGATEQRAMAALANIKGRGGSQAASLR